MPNREALTNANIKKLADTMTKPGPILTFFGVLIGLFIGAAIILPLTIPLMLWRGYAAIKLWQWFIAPIWPGVWHPTMYSAVGVMLVINTFWPHGSSPKETSKYSWVNPFLTPAVALFFGYVWMWLQWGV